MKEFLRIFGQSLWQHCGTATARHKTQEASSPVSHSDSEVKVEVTEVIMASLLSGLVDYLSGGSSANSNSEEEEEETVANNSKRVKAKRRATMGGASAGADADAKPARAARSAGSASRKRRARSMGSAEAEAEAAREAKKKRRSKPDEEDEDDLFVLKPIRSRRVQQLVGKLNGLVSDIRGCCTTLIMFF